MGVEIVHSSWYEYSDWFSIFIIFINGLVNQFYFLVSKNHVNAIYLEISSDVLKTSSFL